MIFGQYQVSQQRGTICGLYYNVPCVGGLQHIYLPQTEVKVHATILATTSRTVLKQTFVNPSTTKGIREVRYAFPLYDGVSVVGFSCHVGDRIIIGEVKEKEEAKEVFDSAVARGETAGLLEQLPEASDVFTTTIGNIPPDARVAVEITYLGELKHDMEVDGIRYTIPTSICPRYGGINGVSLQQMSGTISIAVDAEMAKGSFIRKIQSPTHPIAMSMGTTSIDPDAIPSMNKASATLSLGTAHLETDFVLQVIAIDTGIPKALLETHPTIPNHRALMATLVPKFALPPEKPEIVFVCDQSGSMAGERMRLVVEALQVFLKSLPVGTKFNICSFGNHYSFLWQKSVTYSQETLSQAVYHAAGLQANYGGTDILGPLKATIENRYDDMPLDVILLTDGEIWNQDLVFNYLNEQVQTQKKPIRVFTLGIGSGVSHALIEGVAKAGNGFAQSVSEGEKMGSKVIRMLKGALSPHVNDYTLEVMYEAAEEEDGFEIVEKVADSLKVKLDLSDERSVFKTGEPKKPISLFDTSADPDKSDDTGEDRYAHLVPVPVPRIIQAPHHIPSLFAFNRTTVYLLLGPEAPKATPISVTLRGTSVHGPLELEIPVQTLDTPGETIHQLAAKKAVSELEQGRGWLASACSSDGQLLKTRFEGRFSDMIEREAVRLGVQFQVGGKWCSFVATEKASRENSNSKETTRDWEYLEDEQPAASVAAFPGMNPNPARSIQQYSFTQNIATGTLFGASPPLFGASPSLFGVSPSSNITSGNAGKAFGALQVHSAPKKGDIQSLVFARHAPSTSSQYGGGLFGASQSQPASQNGNTPSSLFGGQAPLTSSQHGGRLFGAFQSQPASQNGNNPSSLFGGQAPPTSSQYGGGLFGASQSQPASQNGNTPSSLFGGQAPPTSSQYRGGLFGASQSQPAPQNGNTPSLLFGGQAPPTSSQHGGGLFGASQSQPASQKENTPSSLFGGFPGSPSAGGLFGAPQNKSVPQEGNNSSLPAKSQFGVLQGNSTQPSLSQRESHMRLHMARQEPCSNAQRQAFPTQIPSSSSPQALLRHLIHQQNFDGSFPYDSSTITLLSVSVEAFERALQNVGQGNEDLLTTALVISCMKKRLQEFKDEWELVVDKAEAWVAERLADLHLDAPTFLEMAEDLIVV